MNRVKMMKVIGLVVVTVLMAAGLRMASGERVRLRLATTTSVDNSGLLAYLLPIFEKKTGIIVDVIAVGTGKALKLAENGDVDVVLVHDPEAEEAFMAQNFGVGRRLIMKNDFIVVGPPEDPAGAKGAPIAADVFDVLNKIKTSSAFFISRGDESGTHKKEQKLWEIVGGPPAANYLETGQGMEATLRVAFEKRAYTLTDRGTYLAVKKDMDPVIIFEDDPALENLYSAIAVNPARHPQVKYNEASALIKWLVSPEGQKAIGAFKVNDQVLFHPAAK